MSKAVMISIQPKWVEKILNGEKTIEVRKTSPKLETPFKVYIYCTKGRELLISETYCNYITTKRDNDIPRDDILNGKVVAEFTCDRVDFINSGCHTMMELEETMYKACVPITTFASYLWKDNRGVYLWHISDLHIYDNPRELSDFHKPCIKVTHDIIHDCYNCEHLNSRHTYCKRVDVGITRPPQSWCFVEEIE